MDLADMQSATFRVVLKRGLFFGAALMLTACASTMDTPIEKTQQIESSEATAEVAAAKPVEVKEEKQAEVPDLPLNAELVYYVLLAEVAGQRGEIGAAAELYSRAADSVESPRLAARSAQIANFSRSKERISHALARWVEVEPSDADVYIMQAPFLMIDGKFDEVVKSVDTAIALQPEKAEVYLPQVADNLSELAKPEQALNTIKSLNVYQQANPEALFVYARLAAFYKQYEDAIEHIDKVLAAEPNDEDAIILKSELLQRLGHGEKAIAFLKSTATKTDASVKARFAYAKLLGENGKVVDARTEFERILADDPNSEETIFALGLLGLEQKDAVTAKRYFSQLKALGDKGLQASYFMGLAEELDNNKEAAMVWFASVPRNSIRFDAAQSRYISMLAEDGGLEKARAHLKLLRKENPEKALQYYSFEATFLRDRGLYKEAYIVYSQALKAYPDSSDLLYGRAMTAEALDDIAGLEVDLNKILAAEPNNPIALNALGYTLADRTDRYEEAFGYIQKALAISPNDAFYLDSLGWVYYRMGKLEEAEKYLRQAASINPDPEFLAHLGEVLWQQGKQQEAQALWAKAIQLDPDNRILKETMERLVKK